MPRRSLRGNVDRNHILVALYAQQEVVVPYVGTWIEMFMTLRGLKDGKVVPYVGTWIEIHILSVCIIAGMASFPTWERG